MPYITKEQRGQGGFSNDADPWHDHDWSVPTDLATLRHRVLPAPDQTRYGRPPREAVRAIDEKDS
ncbi:hypothetical protein [Nocardioides sp. T2.26MG-1]|uniref:hypothetical protein n=1 Tax=Nocardioides sp. T2.26MG-1 TaxID=3041166 RepID=UPI00247745A5|nr:hypothetical protein [Nocardioides sp. T2.26MG-1]CAI9417188.1 hypothetical protein HIDPHFAB_02958 [Nocardioides sp. T2.26MG-1]